MTEQTQETRPMAPVDYFRDDLWKQHRLIEAASAVGTDPKTFVAQAYLYAKANPKILSCNQNSLMAAVLAVLQTGLHLNPQTQLAHIIPYKETATVVIGYQGYIELMHRCGGVVSVDAQVVRAEDDFEVNLGTSPFIRHRPGWLDNPRDAISDNFIAAYCVLTMRGGFRKFELLNMVDVDKAKANSRTGGIWKKYPEAMWRKTAIRKAAKYVPQTPQLAMAMDFERRSEEGESLIVDAEFQEAHGGGASERLERGIAAPDWPSFGVALMKARTRSGVASSEAAAALGVDEGGLFDLEQGAAWNPIGDRINLLEKFARLTDSEMGELTDLLPV